MDIQQLQAATRVQGQTNTPVLKQGDIIQGKVLTLYPDQRAQIQIGTQKMMAQLETALISGGRYHFNVQSVRDNIRLRVLGDKLTQKTEDQVTQLMRHLGIKPSKQHTDLVEKLISEKLPFTKSQLTDALLLVDKAEDKTKAMRVIVRMMAQRLPITEAVFHALYTKKTGEFSEELDALKLELMKEPQGTQLQQKLVEQLSLLTRQTSFSAKNAETIFREHLSRVLRNTGLNYENQPDTNRQNETIKAMLLRLLSSNEGKSNNQVKQVLHFINGLQLDSVDETPNMIQASLQLPGERLGLNRDLQLDFSGKKTATGEISTDHCRIFFYLDLKQLRETIIDMNIQKRAVGLTVFNDHDDAERNLTVLKSKFKETLNKLHYHLSAVTVRPLNQMTRTKTDVQTFMKQGVDFRV